MPSSTELNSLGMTHTIYCDPLLGMTHTIYCDLLLGAIGRRNGTRLEPFHTGGGDHLKDIERSFHKL